MSTKSKNTNQATSSELDNKEPHEPRALGAAEFRPYFPESSGKCIILFGASSLSITEDKGFRPTMTIPYSEEWLSIVSQKVVVSISDSFPKPDNEKETYTATKKATVTVGYLIANALNGSMERGNTNFYAKGAKNDKGETVYPNKNETGLERIANAMTALDLSPSTYGQEKKTTFVWAKFIAQVDADTKEGGPLAEKSAAWTATKKKYPTSRQLESAILKLRETHGAEYWLTAPLAAAGYTDPVAVTVDESTDLL